MPGRPSAPSPSSSPARSDRAGRYGRPLLVVGAAVAAVWLVAIAFVFRNSPGWGYDFEAYLLAAQRLANGASVYLPWTISGPFQPGPYGLYLYAPPLAAAVMPLSALSLPAATALWFAIRAALLVCGVALMPVRRWIRVLIFIAAVFSEPVLTDLNLGNISLIVMFLTVVGWRSLDRPAAAISLAATLAVRPTYALFLVRWLLLRCWRPIVVCLVTGLALIAISLPFVGVSDYLDYFRLIRNLSDLTGVVNNQDLASTLIHLGASASVAGAALFAGYAVASVAMLLSLRRDREVSFMVTLGATLLISPLLQDHFMVGALIPAAFLLQRGRVWAALVILVLLWIPVPDAAVLAVVTTLAPFLARAEREPAYAPPDAGLSNRTIAPA